MAQTKLDANAWESIIKKFGNSCSYCGCESDEIQREHVKPKSKGGKNQETNIVPACPECNWSKGNDSVFKWYLEQDFFTQERFNKIMDHTGGINHG